MKFIFEKDRCKISESVSGLALIIEPKDEPIEVTSVTGEDYLLFDGNDEGIGPHQSDMFLIKKPKEENK